MEGVAFLMITLMIAGMFQANADGYGLIKPLKTICEWEYMDWAKLIGLTIGYLVFTAVYLWMQSAYSRKIADCVMLLEKEEPELFEGRLTDTIGWTNRGRHVLGPLIFLWAIWVLVVAL